MSYANLLTMKKFLLGVVVGILLICVVTAAYRSGKAREAERAAREAAAAAHALGR